MTLPATYNGYDVFIGNGVTQILLGSYCCGATFWQLTSAGAWSYYDGSAWNPTTGFNVEPVNVWFHGYGTETGWDVYNYSAGGSYTPMTIPCYWHNVTAIEHLGLLQRHSVGWAPMRWVTLRMTEGTGRTTPGSMTLRGTYNGYDVFIGNGVTQILSWIIRLRGHFLAADQRRRLVVL